MKTFTLDTNCLYAIDEGRPEATAVRVLADAHAVGKAHVAVVAMAASENQKSDRAIQNFVEFRDRLAALNLAHLDILWPMAYFDVTFFDWSLSADDQMEALERQIHAVLFPGVEFIWKDHCRANGLNPIPPAPTGKWRNRKCDVQAIWAHIHGQRDVFVTTDSDFQKKKSALIKLGAKGIETPGSAISLL